LVDNKKKSIILVAKRTSAQQRNLFRCLLEPKDQVKGPRKPLSSEREIGSTTRKLSGDIEGSRIERAVPKIRRGTKLGKKRAVTDNPDKQEILICYLIRVPAADNPPFVGTQAKERLSQRRKRASQENQNQNQGEIRIAVKSLRWRCDKLTVGIGEKG
jgi:hypothetical protein